MWQFAAAGGQLPALFPGRFVRLPICRAPLAVRRCSMVRNYMHQRRTSLVRPKEENIIVHRSAPTSSRGPPIPLTRHAESTTDSTQHPWQQGLALSAIDDEEHVRHCTHQIGASMRNCPAYRSPIPKRPMPRSAGSRLPCRCISSSSRSRIRCLQATRRSPHMSRLYHQLCPAGPDVINRD